MTIVARPVTSPTNLTITFSSVVTLIAFNGASTSYEAYLPS
jgi:hypothetical protein